MSSNQKLTRSEHVASLSLPPGRVARTLGYLHRSEVLIRISLAVVAALAIWLVTTGWVLPFSYRTGAVLSRDAVARVAFEIPDPERTVQLRKQKRSETACVYVHDDRPLRELRSALTNRIFQILAAGSFEELDKRIWSEFCKPEGAADSTVDLCMDPKEAYETLRAALQNDPDLTRLTQAVQRAFQPYEENGLLEGLTHKPEEGSQISILVYPLGRPDFLNRIDVKDVRIAEVSRDLEKRLADEFRLAEFPPSQVPQLAHLVFRFVAQRGMPTTLKWDVALTEKEYEKQLQHVHAEQAFEPGDRLARGGLPLTSDKIALLRNEHRAVLAKVTALEKIGYTLADWGWLAALYVLCGVYIYSHRPIIIRDIRRLATLLGAIVVTIGVGRVCASDAWQADLVPLLLFSMTMTIVYGRDLALLLAGVVALLACVSFGLGLATFVAMLATAATAILLLNRVRSRTKLIYVGLAVGAVASLTTIGIGTLMGQTIGHFGTTGLLHVDAVSENVAWFSMPLISLAVWNGFCALLASLIMTGLLPFVERLFDVQTDISLLELGDAAHPLLQELARRAPGTYNHSINVASLAEAAAESIGSNGLLVRVGAYFHDIGKVFKPGYFIENQSRETNLHESLMPAMSTLVIIAHVKDGADLARQHRLPQSIIDFVEQHHGTTLVEYFYRQATKQQEKTPENGEVEEASYRYPGPKPQSRETGVLMLADAVEGASRTLVDPTPARIESLINQIAMKRLLDGQFDDCGITLRELTTIQESLVKSLTAVYHARVKYPDQQTA